MTDNQNQNISVEQAEAQEAVKEKIAVEEFVSDKNMPELVIVTGLSGAGRTEAMHVFEDLGYFCIDNLPASFLSQLVDKKRNPNLANADVSAEAVEEKRLKLAVVCDARNREYFGSIRTEIMKLQQNNVDYRILFLDASDEKLISRYKFSRRRHPLCERGETITQGIQKERELLFALREAADYVIDTTEMMPQALRSQISTLFTVDSNIEGLAITVYSFGFKNGTPIDADLMIDVRFLPNPYWDPTMRKMSGLDAPVSDFVLNRQETKDFMEKWYALLDSLIPGYIKEGKQQLAIAIGCTGGQHRSVTITEETGNYLKSKNYRVSVAHRDLQMAIARANGQEFSVPGVASPGLSGRIPQMDLPTT